MGSEMCIRDSYIIDEGQEIGDSTFIIKHLKSKFGDPLAEGLSAEQLATGHVLKVMLEERTYWAGMLYPRWIKTDHHNMLADAFFGQVPRFIRKTIFKTVAKGVSKAADGHGIGRHSEAEIYDLGLDDIKTLETILGDKDFILGAKPAEVDATVYAFLHGFAAEVFPTPIQAHIRGSQVLMAYHDRMDALVFGADEAQ